MHAQCLIVHHMLSSAPTGHLLCFWGAATAVDCKCNLEQRSIVPSLHADNLAFKHVSRRRQHQQICYVMAVL